MCRSRTLCGRAVGRGRLSGLTPFSDAVDEGRVGLAFGPALIDVLGQLPVVEARAECARDRLVFLRAVVVAEAVIGEAQGLGQHPTFAVVLGEEGVEAHALEVLERDLG